MAAHDAATPSHDSETHSVSEASFTWSHDPVGVPKAVLVYVIQNNDNEDRSSAVTYAGASLAAVVGGFAEDTNGEKGACKAWFLGSAVPTNDPATVVVTRTNDTVEMNAVCITVTAAGDCEITAVVLLQENQALAEQSVDDGSPGTNSVRYAGTFYGGSSEPSAGASSTSLFGFDYGTKAANTVVETTAGQGARSVGFSASADDVAAVHVAISEVASGAQNLTGALFAKAPTFFAGAVTPGAVGLAGSLFTKAPTFNAGAVTSIYPLAGNLFTKSPNFFQGAMTVGAVDLGGVLFQRAPTFFGGAVTSVYDLAGALFQNVPSFFQGALTSLYDLDGNLFIKAPTFFTGDVVPGAVDLAGSLFTNVPTFFAGTVSTEGGTRTLDGVLFIKAPTFLTGALTSTYPLAGTLFQKAPTFNIGAITSTFDLAGVLFQKAPTFGQGAITSLYPLTGNLFTKTPTFFVGDVDSVYNLGGVLFQKTPTFFAGDIIVIGGAQTLTGQLFVVVPLFFVGSVELGAMLIGMPTGAGAWPGRSNRRPGPFRSARPGVSRSSHP